MRIIVAYAAGGANDLLARVFSERSCRPSDRRVKLPV
jgi:tripartite-type tricarboxylate transporter receptor subunit TctC